MIEKEQTSAALEALKSTFGLEAFRPGQEEVIDRLLAGRPALAVFPTGGGKSLCYQLPAVLMDGLTLVVSPLIALMKDQVDVLRSKGIAAARLDSSLDADEARETLRQLAEGELNILYLAPERLAGDLLLRRLRRVPISLLAIDEAHCISEWGHNFRPDYLKLARLARELNAGCVLALTATATPRVAEDVRAAFEIAEEDHVGTGFRRSNLTFRVSPCTAGERDNRLVERLHKDGPGSAIVYVTLQHTAETVAGLLSRDGIPARAYHAGMRDQDREEVQNAFMSGELGVVVATIAFGMGIDKANIRAIYHYNLPKSLESYVQETGRAGRDGDPAVCDLLACRDDCTVLENFSYGDTPTPEALGNLVHHLLRQGDGFDVSRHELSAVYDIRQHVVATVLTYLELEDVIESTGPFYDTYRFQFLQPEEKILSGYDEDRARFLAAMFGTAKKARKWLTLRASECAATLGESRERVVAALGHLEEMGVLNLETAGFRHGYRLKQAPSDPADLVRRMFRAFQARETRDIGRIRQVVEFAESDACMVGFLEAYFGEKSGEDCGVCAHCAARADGAGSPVPLPSTPPRIIGIEDLEAIQKVMAERLPALRAPRQLARFLCGISSPAASRARLSQHDAFALLEDVPFETVLETVGSMIAE